MTFFRFRRHLLGLIERAADRPTHKHESKHFNYQRHREHRWRCVLHGKQSQRFPNNWQTRPQRSNTNTFLCVWNRSQCQYVRTSTCQSQLPTLLYKRRPDVTIWTGSSAKEFRCVRVRWRRRHCDAGAYQQWRHWRGGCWDDGESVNASEWSSGFDTTSGWNEVITGVCTAHKHTSRATGVQHR